MKLHSLVAASAVAAALSAGPLRGGDLASEVRAVFSAKCAGCHGANLPKPKGRFGYVLDLKRLAGNPEMVVPGKPDESELLSLINNGDMPPSDAKSGPLTDKQKEVVRDWIAAGAPEGNPPDDPLLLRTDYPAPSAAEAPAPQPFAVRLLRQLGKLHLLFLHFPIALLLAASLGEGWSAWKRASIPSPAVRFCLCLGAAAAIPTVACGWLFAQGGFGAGSPGLLALHRWLGTAAGAWAVATAVCSEWDARRGARSLHVRLMLLLAVLLVALAAHLGGLLMHGTDFFDW